MKFQRYARFIRTLLLYPPNQSWPDTMCKPNGSLAYPMLGGALLEAGHEVKVFDACVGDEKDDLSHLFSKATTLPSGLLRTGVNDDRILEEVEPFDLIGLTSIFSSQETMVLHTVALVKNAFPEKIVVVGGVNARNRLEPFFEAGVDIIFTSEAERSLVQLVRQLEAGNLDLDKIDAIAYQVDGKIIRNDVGEIVWDLDELPMPAWHLLPNERYWRVARPHGGSFSADEEVKYASMQTSMGCPFECSFCHIAGETADSIAGPVGRFRIKSDERVLAEMEELEKLGVQQIFIEDDTLFGKKQRAIRLLEKINQAGFDILDVNGVNLVHMFKNNEPDEEVIRVLDEANFKEIALAFESANPRILKKYASNKWNVNNSDVPGLLQALNEYDLTVEGNYMIGYPDETREEIQNTIDFAKSHVENGLDVASFMLVMPLPGTPLFDYAIREGYLPEDFNIDKLYWGKANMINTAVPAEELEELRRKAWEEINSPEYKTYKKEMIVK